VFACHKTKDGQDQVCAGYLLVDGNLNFAVRIAVIQGRFDPEALKSPYPLYESYREMALANGARLKEED
jgi:hypothetical protein